MPAPDQTETARLLRVALEQLQTDRPDAPVAPDALSTAGAALEQAVTELPEGLPGAGAVLSLALEALQGVYTEDLPNEDALPAIIGGVEAVANRLDAPEGAADGDCDAVEAAGRELWALHERDPELSPFSEPACEAPPSPPESPADPSINDRVATLITLSPDDTSDLANLAAWLVERVDDEALSPNARDAADRARDLICSVLDETADDPGEALNRAAAVIGEMAAPPTDESDSFDAEETPAQCEGTTKSGARCSLPPGEGSRYCHLHREQAPDSAADTDRDANAAPEAPPDDEPTCLEFSADATLLAEFIAESLDHIQRAEAGMLTVETDPDDVEAVNAVFRAFHTIKGAAGFLGLATVQELAHKAENLLDRVRQGEIELSGGYADLALDSSDALKQMLQDLDGWQEGPLPPPPPQFVELLTKLRDPDAAVSDDHDLTPDAVARTGDILVKEGIVDRETVERLAAEDDGRPIGERIVEAGAASTAEVAGALRKQRKASQSIADASVRVATDRLDSLINMVGELVIANAMLAQDRELRERSGQDVVRKIDQISKITRELQDVSMSLRMVPLSGTFQRMARLVRDLSRKSGKQVELVTEGEDTEIDRNMVEAISDPLLHMVRNAVDHGIEPPEARREAGKPESGTVTLRAYHAAGSVIIELEDDGRGLDRDRIYAKAVRNGVISDGAQLSDEEVYRLVFEAGLSTAEEVTDISGRGVGMDVVRRNIEAMRGRIDIDSTLGEGTTFTVRVPLTLAIIDGMLLRVGSERYILPTVSIQQAFRPAASDVRTIASSGEMVRFRGEMIPLLRVHRLFDLADARTDVGDNVAVVVERNGEMFALLVEELLGQQQIVIKSLGADLANADTVAGAAVLGDGSVGLILDVDGMIALAEAERAA